MPDFRTAIAKGSSFNANVVGNWPESNAHTERLQNWWCLAKSTANMEAELRVIGTWWFIFLRSALYNSLSQPNKKTDQ
jgi:hypothetical protein